MKVQVSKGIATMLEQLEEHIEEPKQNSKIFE